MIKVDVPVAEVVGEALDVGVVELLVHVGVGEDGPAGDPNLVQGVPVRVANLPCGEPFRVEGGIVMWTWMWRWMLASTLVRG